MTDSVSGQEGRRRGIKEAVEDAMTFGDYAGGIQSAIKDSIDSRAPLSRDIAEDLKSSFCIIFKGSRDSDLRRKYTSLMNLLNSCIGKSGYEAYDSGDYARALDALENYRSAAEICLAVEAGYPRALADSSKTKDKKESGWTEDTRR